MTFVSKKKLFIVISLILTLTSCGSFLSQEDLAFLSSSASVEIEAIAENALDLEEYLDFNPLEEGGKIRRGKGFFISSEGKIMTNAHLVRGASSVFVFYKDKKYSAEIVFIDEKKDLALLQAKINSNDFLETGSAEDEKVFLLDAFYVLDGDKVKRGLSKGFSGTPVLNLQGEAVGIYTASSDSEGLITLLKNKP